MAIDELFCTSQYILDDGNYTPFDIMFEFFFIRNYYDECAENIRAWYPLSEETKRVMQQTLNSIDRGELTREAICLLYGFDDGKYYSISETAKKLETTVVSVLTAIGIVARTFHEARDKIWVTLGPEALKEIQISRLAQIVYSYIEYDVIADLHDADIEKLREFLLLKFYDLLFDILNDQA